MFYKNSSLAETQILVATDNWRDFIKDSSTYITAEAIQNVLKENTYLKKEDFAIYLARFVSAGEKWGYNGNRDYFPEEELKNNYKSFIRRGVYINHDNYPKSKAIGIIPYAMYDEENGYVYGVLAISKEYGDIIAAIDNGDIEGTSMGASVSSVRCPVCGAVCETTDDYCEHLENKEQHDAYDICQGVNFIEHSVLHGEPPADGDALVVEKLAKKVKKQDWRNTVREFKKISEEKEKESDYDKFIEKKLKEWDVDSLGDLNDADSKKFFKEVDDEWVSEEEEEEAKKKDDKESADKKKDDKDDKADEEKEEDEDDDDEEDGGDKDDKDKDKDDEDKDDEEDEDKDDKKKDSARRVARINRIKRTLARRRAEKKGNPIRNKKRALFFVDADDNEVEGTSVGSGSRVGFNYQGSHLRGEIRELTADFLHINMSDGGSVSLPRKRNYKIRLERRASTKKISGEHTIELFTTRGQRTYLYITYLSEDQYRVEFEAQYGLLNETGGLSDILGYIEDELGYPLENDTGYVISTPDELIDYIEYRVNRDAKVNNKGGSYMRPKKRKRVKRAEEDQPITNSDGELSTIVDENAEGETLDNEVEEVVKDETTPAAESGGNGQNLDDVEKADQAPVELADKDKDLTQKEILGRKIRRARAKRRIKARIEARRRKLAEEVAEDTDTTNVEPEEIQPKDTNEKTPADIAKNIGEVGTDEDITAEASKRRRAKMRVRALGLKRDRAKRVSAYFAKRYKLDAKKTASVFRYALRYGSVDREQIKKMLNLDWDAKKDNIPMGANTGMGNVESAFPEIQTDLADPQANSGSVSNKFFAMFKKNPEKVFKRALSKAKKAVDEEGDVSDAFIQNLGDYKNLQEVDNGVYRTITEMVTAGASYMIAGQTMLNMNVPTFQVMKALNRIAGEQGIRVNDIIRQDKRTPGKIMKKRVASKNRRPVTRKKSTTEKKPIVGKNKIVRKRNPITKEELIARKKLVARRKFLAKKRKAQGTGNKEVNTAASKRDERIARIKKALAKRRLAQRAEGDTGSNKRVELRKRVEEVIAKRKGDKKKVAGGNENTKRRALSKEAKDRIRARIQERIQKEKEGAEVKKAGSIATQAKVATKDKTIETLQEKNAKLSEKVNELVKEKATASEVREASTKLASLTGVGYDEWKTKLSAMNITEFRGALKLLSDMENAKLNEMVKSSKKATNEDKISGGILVPTSKGESGALDKLAKAFTEGLGE